MVIARGARRIPCSAALSSSSDGLSKSEARERLREHGSERLARGRQAVGLGWRFLMQFHNVLIYVLIAAARAHGAPSCSTWIDTNCYRRVVVIINSIIGFIQEGKSGAKALRRHSQSASPGEKKRGPFADGQNRSIDAKELVPVDIVLA